MITLAIILLQGATLSSALLLPLNYTNLHFNSSLINSAIHQISPNLSNSSSLSLPPLPYNFPIDISPGLYLRFLRYGDPTVSADVVSVVAQAGDELESIHTHVRIIRDTHIWTVGTVSLTLAPNGDLPDLWAEMMLLGIIQWEDAQESVEFDALLMQRLPRRWDILASIRLIDSSR